MEEEPAVKRIGVTGHVNVSEDVARWVTSALTRRLGAARGAPVRGITCLAKGADQIFAEVVLAASGTIEVVLPARDYRQAMVEAGDAEPFCGLLDQAAAVETMPFETSSRAAYLAASEEMLSRCDLLLAVWDGEPSRRVGDTADVVTKALERDVPVEVLWPTPAEVPGRG